MDLSGVAGRDGDFAELLGDARQGDCDALGRLLEWYSSYLRILASTQLDRRLASRLSPSDVVQETMLAAHQDFGDFRGQSQPELLSWLRRILVNTLHRAFAVHVKAERRDVRREVSIDEVSRRLEESACNLAAILPGRGVSPSAPMQAREWAVEFADQLAVLKPSYRDVILYRILQGLTFEEIAERMGKSNGAVRMLWLRALDAFKTQTSIAHDP